MIQTRWALCLRRRFNISEAQIINESVRNINHFFPSTDLMSQGSSSVLNVSYPTLARMAERDETGDLSRMWTHNQTPSDPRGFQTR